MTVEEYLYQDADGTPVQRVIRNECRSCPEKHKSFPQQFVGKSGNWVDRAPTGFRRVLYRLPQVVAAVAGQQSVWLMEGEKDVAAGVRAGLVATTNPQGGRDLVEAVLQDLAGAAVNVVLDRDDTGWARGVAAYDILTPLGCKVRLFLPATLEHKSDFTDHVDAGYTVSELLEVTRSEVATWNSLTGVRGKAEATHQAIDEAAAHLDAAQAGRGADPETHRRHARRWVLESQLRFERADQLGNEAATHAVAAGTLWAAAGLEEVRRRLESLSQDVARIHEACGVPLPAGIAGPVADAASDPGESRRAERTAFDTKVLPGTPTYRIVDNAIMQWEPPRRRSDDEDDESGTLKLVLGLAVRVVSREFLETDDEDLDVGVAELLGRTESLEDARLNPPPPRRLSGMVLTYIHPDTGEETFRRVTAEEWKDHSWLDSLPGPPDYDHRKSGLDAVQRAVLAISAGLIADTVRYRSTGWRENGDQHMYVHQRGVITADGHRSAPTFLGGPLRRYNWPDPTHDADRLRSAFLGHSAALLDRVPARVAVPLLGQVFRAVLGPNPWVLTLVGSPGSYKTSVAAKVMHHFGEQWDHTNPTSSMSGNGDTLNAMRLKLHNSKDALYWMDDFAPTKRLVDAQKLLEEMTRLIHNREERNRSTRDGLDMTAGTGPRASGLATSEVMPRPGSAAERMLVVPLASEDIDTDLLFPLDEPDSRYSRALVMASFVQWLAADLIAYRHRYLSLAEQHSEALVAAGKSVREAAALSQIRAGWVAITDFLVSVRALQKHEAGELLHRVDVALDDASRAASDPDLPGRTGARVRELLAYALASGLAYVDDVRTGECPEWPLARRLGWRRTPLDNDPLHGTSRTRLERQGQRLGFVLLDPEDGSEPTLLCDPAALEPVLKTAANTMADGLQIDRQTANRALRDEGILIPDLSEADKIRYTVHRTIWCEERKQRVTVLRLYPLLGDVDPGEGGQPADGHGGPATDPGSTPPGGAAPPQNGPPAQPGGAGTGDDPQPEASGPVDDLSSEQPPLGETIPMPTDNTYDVTDAEGLRGWARAASEAQPCLLCRRNCIMTFDGRYIHPVCWSDSTAAQRATAEARQPGPATPATHEPSTPGATLEQPALAVTATTRAVPFRAAAAVLTDGQVVVGDGTSETVPWPIRHVGDLARLAEWLNLGSQVTRHYAAAGQLWLTAEALSGLGLDPGPLTAADVGKREELMREITRGQSVVTDALTDGWRIGGREGDCLGRWTRLRRGDNPSVWIAVLPALDHNPAAGPLFADNPDPATLAKRLQLFATTVGFPYQLSSSTTGLDLAMALRGRDRERLFEPFEPVEPAQLANTELDISWCRPPTQAEAAQRYLHAYDRGGSYLAGASVDLGVGRPDHHLHGCDFDPRVPGYWLVEVPPSSNWRMPHLLDPVGNREGKPTWRTTPAVQFALEQDYDLKVLEAYTWQEKLRILDPWYERMRDSRTKLDTADVDDQAVRSQVKVVYASTIGMMGSDTFMRGRPGYAPDRRHHIVAKARTNILRRVAKIGADTDRWPVAVVADTILYTSDEPDPVKAWPGQPGQLGRGLGQYKPEATARLADHLQYLTGGRYRGKDQLSGPTASDT